MALLLMSLLCVSASFAWAVPLESPQKLSPQSIPVKTVKPIPVAQVVPNKPLSEAIPLSDIQEKPVPLAQALKPDNNLAEQSQMIYGMLAFLLICLIGALFLKSPRYRLWLRARLFSDFASLSPRSSGVIPSAPKTKGRNPFGALLEAVQQKNEPDESDFYRPNVVHRQRLGGGRELLTVHQAGQWLLLGVTPTQIQFLANLTDEVVKTEPSKLEDPELAGLYDKYVEPLVVKSEKAKTSERVNGHNKNRMDFMTSPSQTTVSLETLPESELDETEFQLPDFEDVFDPLLTASSRPIVRLSTLSQQPPNYLV